MVTIFKNIFSKEPFYITVEMALERIKAGKSKELVEDVRKQIDKERADKLKINLPSVCFSGKFTERKDEALQAHSGLIVLDFDNLEHLRNRQTEIISLPWIYACWISPRANGLKALVKIADPLKHREHFQAIQEILKDVDSSGINVSRVCFESYDPGIYINPKATIFKKVLTKQKVQGVEVLQDKKDIYDKILVWLTNKGDAFKTGERNSFIFKLASACCRFGISEIEATGHITNDFVINDSTFALSEATAAIKSAYKRNNYATAVFERDILIDAIQKIEPMLVNKICDHLTERITSGELSNDNLVQIIEHIGGYLNLKTIPDYSKENNISYNGAKNFRVIKPIFGVKFVIDND